MNKNGRSAPGAQDKDRGRAALLADIRLFVLDMDGTFYLGDRRLDGSLEFVRYVQEKGRRILFFTNNSSRSPEVYVDRLAGMDCRISRDQIMTSPI